MPHSQKSDLLLIYFNIFFFEGKESTKINEDGERIEIKDFEVKTDEL